MNYYQISYPRSGSHLVRSISRVLLGLPQCPTHSKDYFLYKYVRRHYFPKAMQKNASVILLLRNPIDVLVRQNQVADADVVSRKFEEHLRPNPNQPIEENGDCGDWSYISLIRNFDMWKNKKTMFYYEDFISNISTFVLRLADFLSATEKFKDYCLENIDTIFKSNLKLYNAVDGDGSFTKGDLSIRHRDRLSKDNQLAIQEYIKQYYPRESQYLERYFNEI